jgi:hypothetical protein
LPSYFFQYTKRQSIEIGLDDTETNINTTTKIINEIQQIINDTLVNNCLNNNDEDLRMENKIQQRTTIHH